MFTPLCLCASGSLFLEYAFPICGPDNHHCKTCLNSTQLNSTQPYPLSNVFLTIKLPPSFMHMQCFGITLNPFLHFCAHLCSWALCILKAIPVINPLRNLCLAQEGWALCGCQVSMCFELYELDILHNHPLHSSDR